MKILGITPARGGSKGLPKKNIRPLAGKPLLAWTIEAARGAKSIDQYVVSTESAEIANVARDYGAEVVDRPEEFATDDASTMSVLQHALSQVPADVVVLLQATCPIRKPGLIDSCVERFLSTHADSLATGFICKYQEYGTNELNRQDIKGFFYDDGNIYIMKADLIQRGDRYGKHVEKVILDREQNVDIDEEFDFWLAEQILTQRMVHA